MPLRYTHTLACVDIRFQRNLINSQFVNVECNFASFNINLNIFTLKFYVSHCLERAIRALSHVRGALRQKVRYHKFKYLTETFEEDGNIIVNIFDRLRNNAAAAADKCTYRGSAHNARTHKYRSL